MYSIWHRVGEKIHCLGQADTFSEANALALTLDYDPADLWVYDQDTAIEFNIEIPAS